MVAFMGGCHQSARSSTLFCDVFNANKGQGVDSLL